MVVLGIDAHKRSHTVVAVDDVGRKLGERTRGTTTADHLVMLTWAEQFGADRLWAVEDCRHLSRRLERDLLGAGERIARVPPKLMAHVRDSARSYGKSDRSTPSPSLVRRCVNPTCPPPPSTALPGRSACWPTTAMT
jgi:transposase